MSKQKDYLDKIVEHLVNRTKYDTDHLNVYIIKFPFSDDWEVFGSHGETSGIYDISTKRFENYRWNFDQEMIEVFDLMDHESDYVWEMYFEGARFFGIEYANSKGSINESVDKQKNFYDKVLERLLKETVITDSKITFPFAIFKQPELTGDSLLSVSQWIDGRWENHKYPHRFHKYVNDIYGITYMESLGLWNSYMDIIEEEVSKRLKRPSSDFYNMDLNESMDIEFLKDFTKDLNKKQKGYLDKVVEHLLRETEIDRYKKKVYFPFSSSSPSSPFTLFFSYFFAHPSSHSLPFSHSFYKHCRDIYGLNNHEIDYVWEEYRNSIIYLIKSNE